MNDGRPGWLDDVVAGVRTFSAAELDFGEGPPPVSARLGAVLMLFGDGPDGPELLFTERSHTMRSHPGQVSFPGGSVDPGETAEQAALREAREEIGLDARGVEVVGRLPQLYLPPSDFSVTPVVGWWREPAELGIASHEEVHAIHRVAVSALTDTRHRIRVRSPRNPTWVMPGFLIGPEKDVILWGFTGGIVTRFLGHIGWLEDAPGAPIVDLPDYMLRGRERE